MNVEWALKQLNLWLHLNERVPLAPELVKPNRKTTRRGTTEQRVAIDNVAWEIAKAVYVEPPRDPRYINEEYVRRLIWELTEGDEVRSHLDLVEPPPAIAAESLHPWVWDAARPHWLGGNHDAAVWAAAINVNTSLQNKVRRRDAGEGRLIRESFSTDDPKPGQPRLRRCGPENPDLFRDMHVGASHLGQGVFSAVRNPLNHVTADEHGIGEAEALEALASLSLLARWIDQAEVDRGPEA
jgi:hypothetical protein